VRIDGAPSLVDLESYQVELKDSLDATLRDPAKAVALVLPWSAIHRALPARRPPTLPPTLPIPPRKPPVKLRLPQRRTGTFTAPPLRPPTPPTPPPLCGARLFRPVGIAPSRWRRPGSPTSKAVNSCWMVPSPDPAASMPLARPATFCSGQRPPDAVPCQLSVHLGRSRYNPTARRTDAVWIHYDGNTNSILERNIGQALGWRGVRSQNL